MNPFPRPRHECTTARLKRSPNTHTLYSLVQIRNHVINFEKSLQEYLPRKVEPPSRSPTRKSDSDEIVQKSKKIIKVFPLNIQCQRFQEFPTQKLSAYVDGGKRIFYPISTPQGDYISPRVTDRRECVRPGHYAAFSIFSLYFFDAVLR